MYIARKALQILGVQIISVLFLHSFDVYKHTKKMLIFEIVPIIFDRFLANPLSEKGWWFWIDKVINVFFDFLGRLEVGIKQVMLQ